MSYPGAKPPTKAERDSLRALLETRARQEERRVLIMGSDYPAFLIRSSEGKRTSVAPEDLPEYLVSRDAVLDALRGTPDAVQG